MREPIGVGSAICWPEVHVNFNVDLSAEGMNLTMSLDFGESNTFSTNADPTKFGSSVFSIL
jgi:hypothetical protein